MNLRVAEKRTLALTDCDPRLRPVRLWRLGTAARPSKQSITPRCCALAGNAESPLYLFRRTPGGPGRPSGWTSQAPEHLEVVGVDCPDRPHLDAIEPLADQQPADVGVRGFELGSSLRDGQQTWPFHDNDTSTSPQQFRAGPAMLKLFPGLRREPSKASGSGVPRRSASRPRQPLP